MCFGRFAGLNLCSTRALIKTHEYWITLDTAVCSGACSNERKRSDIIQINRNIKEE
jgi:hypothetical protein